MIKPPYRTNAAHERGKGRVTIWLDVADTEWLSKHCCCPPDAPAEVKERCARIRFRTSAAWHKSGLKK